MNRLAITTSSMRASLTKCAGRIPWQLTEETVPQKMAMKLPTPSYSNGATYYLRFEKEQ